MDSFDKTFTAFDTDSRFVMTCMVESISAIDSTVILAEYVCERCGSTHFVMDVASDKTPLLVLSEGYMKAVAHADKLRAAAVDKTIKVSKNDAPLKAYVYDVCPCRSGNTAKSRSVLKYHQKLTGNDKSQRLYKFIVDTNPESSESRKVLALCPASVIFDKGCVRGSVGDDAFNFLRGFAADMELLPCIYDRSDAVMICSIKSKNRVYNVIQDQRFVDRIVARKERLLAGRHGMFAVDHLDSLFERQLYELAVPKVMLLLCGLTADRLPDRSHGSTAVINNDGRGFCVFYGDGGTAKTSLLEGYALRFLGDTNGQTMSGETASMVGLTGGIDTSSPLGAYIAEGAMTKANKAILLIDGGQQMREYISKMRECFTKGVIKIRKVLSGDLPARTRITMAYNLRKNLGDYGSKISAMKDIGSSKQEKSGKLASPDVRRFDMMYPFEFKGKKHAREDSYTSPEFIKYYKDLLVVAWTIRSEDVVVDGLDLKKMDHEIDRLVDRFGVLIDYAMLNSTRHVTFFKYMVAAAILNGRVKYKGGHVKVYLDDADILFVYELVEAMLMANQIDLISIELDSDLLLMDAIIHGMTATQKKHLMGIYNTSSGRVETYAAGLRMSVQAVYKVFRKDLVTDIVVDGVGYKYSISHGALDCDCRVIPPIYIRGLTYFGSKVCRQLKVLETIKAQADAGDKICMEAMGMKSKHSADDQDPLAAGKPKAGKHVSREEGESISCRYIDTVIVNSLRESPMTNLGLFGLVALLPFAGQLIMDRLKSLVNRNIIAYDSKEPFTFYLLDTDSS